MIQQIVVKDESGKKIGTTYPRRAKQLVSTQKARWASGAENEIILTAMDGESDSVDMIASLAKEKSIVKDAYRENASVVLKSTPFEMIKKSKRRTRELHAAFSLVLWVGAAMIYFVVNFALGSTKFSLNPATWSWTWLVFVLALIIECSAEIYFSKKELDVLTENIDLRQINPHNGDDLDLHGYHKKLTRKIKIMSSTVIWVPLVLIFFVIGYATGLWSSAWMVLLLGVFFELVHNFVKKLKKPVET